jgi:hypothetical protein
LRSNEAYFTVTVPDDTEFLYLTGIGPEERNFRLFVGDYTARLPAAEPAQPRRTETEASGGLAPREAIWNEKLGSTGGSAVLYLKKVERLDGMLVFHFYFLNKYPFYQAITKIDNAYYDEHEQVQELSVRLGRWLYFKEDRSGFRLAVPETAGDLHLEGVGRRDRRFRLKVEKYAGSLFRGGDYPGVTAGDGLASPPSLLLTAPRLTGPEIEVNDYLYEVAGRAVSETGIATVTVNGRAARLQRDGTFATTLRLRIGDNPIRLVAEDLDGQSTTAAFLLIRRDQQESGPIADVERIRVGKGARPDAVAVIIGNRDYGPDVPPVDFAVSDARTMREFVVTALGYRPGNVIYLENARKTDFESVFGTSGDHRGRLFNYVKPEVSDIFVYYSGHGAPDLETRRGYLVPADVDPMQVRLNGYSLETLYGNLVQVPARNVTVVLESCFSGAYQGGSLLRGVSPIRIAVTRPEGILRDAVVLTSSTDSQVSHWYPEMNHSLFTYFFLKGALGGADGDGNDRITFAELDAYLKEEVPYATRRLHGRDQVPQVFASGETVFVEYR